MASTSIIIHLEEDLKKKVEELFDDMGLDMTKVFTLFVKAAVREQKIPFEIGDNPFGHESYHERLMRGIAQLNAGQGIIRDLIEVGE